MLCFEISSFSENHLLGEGRPMRGEDSLKRDEHEQFQRVARTSRTLRDNANAVDMSLNVNHVVLSPLLSRFAFSLTRFLPRGHQL